MYMYKDVKYVAINVELCHRFIINWRRKMNNLKDAKVKEDAKNK